MTIELEKHDGIATVSLNRPEKLNALTDEMYVRLIDIFAELAVDDAVRVVVLTGKGGGFCEMNLDEFLAEARELEKSIEGLTV